MSVMEKWTQRLCMFNTHPWESERGAQEIEKKKQKQTVDSSQPSSTCAHYGHS